VPELGDRELHLRALGCGRVVGFRIARLLAGSAGFLRGDHHCFERRDIVGETISGGPHDPTAAQNADLASLDRALIHYVAEPAACGPKVS
jgi:hypothetical protein